MTGHRRQFNRSLLAILALLSLAPRASGQQCEGVRTGVVLGLIGGWVATEAVAIAARHDEWWPEPSADFELVWDASANKEQDRLLHAEVGYQLSQISALGWDQACMSHKTATWGDGFQEGKGFSVPDMVAAAGGAILPALHRTWDPAQAILLKVNYWPSDEYRDRTGTYPTLATDYAGQRYFLALNPGRLSNGAGAWPDWLGVAVGHSVPYWVSEPPIDQWYFVFDLNLRGLPIRAAWWQSVAAVLDQIHLPLPGVRVEGGGVRFGLY